MLFSLVKKVTKINLKVSFFRNMSLTVRQRRFVASFFGQFHTVGGYCGPAHAHAEDPGFRSHAIGPALASKNRGDG